MTTSPSAASQNMAHAEPTGAELIDAASRFDPNKYMIRVQGNREYLPASARLVWFRQDHEDWGIVTTPVEINLSPEGRHPYAIFQAQIFDGTGRLIATAHKYEDVKGFPDFLEKAETGAVSRALSYCGYGTANAPELDEGERLADSPVQRPDRPRQAPQGQGWGGGGNRGQGGRY